MDSTEVISMFIVDKTIWWVITIYMSNSLYTTINRFPKRTGLALFWKNKMIIIHFQNVKLNITKQFIWLKKHRKKPYKKVSVLWLVELEYQIWIKKSIVLLSTILINDHWPIQIMRSRILNLEIEIELIWKERKRNT